MKFLLTVVAVIGAMSFAVVSAEKLKAVERFWTILPPNSVMFTLNQSEPHQPINIKKRIDYYNPLLLSAVIKNKKTNQVIYRTGQKPVNVCARNNKKDSWSTVVHLIFRVMLLPGRKWWSACPIEPQEYTVERRRMNIEWVEVPDLPEGRYEIDYTVKTGDGEIVFKPLKFTFNVDFKIYVNFWPTSKS